MDDKTILPNIDPAAPGASVDRPFVCVLSKMTDGVAEPVVEKNEKNDPTEPVLDLEKDNRTLVKYRQCPVGWKLGRVHATSGRCYTSLDGSNISLTPGTLVYVDTSGPTKEWPYGKSFLHYVPHSVSS